MYTFAMTRIESSSKWNSKKYVLPKIWHWKEKFRRNKIEFCGDPWEGFGSSSDAWWYWYFFISKSFKNIQPFNSSVCSLSYSCETLIEPGASSELRSQGFVVRLLISGACLHSLMECVLCFTKLPCSPLEHACVLYVCTFALLNYCAWGKKKILWWAKETVSMPMDPCHPRSERVTVKAQQWDSHLEEFRNSEGKVLWNRLNLPWDLPSKSSPTASMAETQLSEEGKLSK